MEKKIWTKPEVGAVQFTANEYVAACSSRIGDYTHDHDISYTDQYILLIDSNANNEFDYSASDYMNAAHAYDDILAPGTMADYNTESYFEFITTYTDNTSDQAITWNYEDGSRFFIGCSNENSTVPEETFTGWWTNMSGNLLGRAQIWWDNVIHATFANASHSG